MYSVTKGFLCNILIEVVILKRLVRLTILFVSEMFRRVRVDKNTFDTFAVMGCVKQSDVLPPLLSYFSLQYATRSFK
jgi:hypothetical protein